MLKGYSVLTLIIFTLNILSINAAVNFCNDPDTWKEWDELIQKYPDDEDIHILHALRLGLCAKVEKGDITVEQATDIFKRCRRLSLKNKN